jgi:catalase
MTPTLPPLDDGTLGSRTRIETNERTSAITGSIEFDAILVAAGSLANSKLIVLLKEAFRHAKVLGAGGDRAAVLEVDITAPGVLASDSIVAASSKELIALLGLHQVSDHASPIMNSAGPAA